MKVRLLFVLLPAAMIGGSTGCLTLHAPVREIADREARSHPQEERADEGPPPLDVRRFGPDRDIPLRVRARAVEGARRQGLLRESPGTWYSEGPTNVGGRVTSLAVDPNDPAHLWLGAAEGGVFTSTNGGIDWTPVFDDQVTLAIGSIEAHPTESSIVYVGTGEDTGSGYSYDGDGVYKTTDGGLTWTNLGLAETRRIGRIAIDPSDPQRVFVAAGGSWFHADEHRGVYRSVDGGTTWEKVLYVAPDAGAIDLAFDPVTPSRMYAAIWQRSSYNGDRITGGPRSGIYRSTDGGTTWSRLGLPVNVGRIGLAVAPSSPNVVFAEIANPQFGLRGIFRSTNYGDTWSQVSQPGVASMVAPYSWYFGNIRVSPTDPSVVYFLDVFLLQSVNGGVTFAYGTDAVHADWHDMILEPGRMLGATDGGFHASTDGGVTWWTAPNLPITQFYDLGIDRLQPEIRFGAFQDNGVQRTTTGLDHDWTMVVGNDGLQAEVDPADSSKVYAATQGGVLERSVDGGDTFQDGGYGVTGSERANWKTPIEIDPVTPEIVYHGRQSVWRSTNHAASWARIGPDMTNGAGTTLIEGSISVVRVSPVDHAVVWTGTDDGNVWVTTDAGATWTQVNPPGPAYWVTDVAPDPFDARTAYVSVSGFHSGVALPYLRVTRDLGATWQDVSAGLPQVPINAVLADTDWRGRIFVGSDIGVARSDDGGVSWSDMRTGLPYVVVTSLQREDLYDTLFAGTYGRSMYSFWLAQLPPADGDADGFDNNHDCALADPGAFALPSEVGPVAIARGPAGETLLSWAGLASSAGPATVYDIATGTLAELSAGGTAGSTPLICALPDPAEVDPAMPATGAGVYYLVRARNTCGKGSWGSGSAGIRVSEACP